MTEQPQTSHHSHGAGGYEKRDVNMKLVLLWTVASVLFIVISLVVINSYFVLTTEDVVYQSVLKPQAVTFRELRAREDQALNSYKVLDPAKGIYQIPIERAMELVADEAYRAPRPK
ncbi:MAG: hypothetical protein AB1644_10810 [Candidatus Zixiibacteriota bacterium]